MSLDAYNQNIRLEISPNARLSKVFVGDTEVSKDFHTIDVHSSVNDAVTAITLSGYLRPFKEGPKPLIEGPEPLVIEGVLIPKEDAQDYLEWKREKLRA